MPDQRDVNLTRGLPETVLPALEPAVETRLIQAWGQPDPLRRREDLAAVAAAHPRCLQAWACLAEVAEQAGDPISHYAFGRVGYHRGLDALRAAGWRGSGYVRWRHRENRGFLRSLVALQHAAGAIGELDEEERCRLFLHQLDPEWPPDHLDPLD